MCQEHFQKPIKIYFRQIKEALGLIFAVKKFNKKIYGRELILQTDHQSLENIWYTYTAKILRRYALILQ